jgi:endonuclease YncB( thermonuclease family)
MYYIKIITMNAKKRYQSRRTGVVHAMRSWRIVVVVCIALGSWRTVWGFNATVVGIPDGDTVEVFAPDEPSKIVIDLYGIDCPEKQQSSGLAAKNATAALVGGKNVGIEILSKSRSGQLNALITVEGNNVNETLVAEGWAWVSPTGCRHAFCADWQRIEDEARRERKGLWAAPQPQPPWEWRKRGKQEFFYMAPGTKTPVWRYTP